MLESSCSALSGDMTGRHRAQMMLVREGGQVSDLREDLFIETFFHS